MLTNRMKFIIIFIIFFIPFNIVKANSIRNIDMDIYISKDGNANVVETWDVKLNKGTEGYRIFSGLGPSSISNFSVYDEKGRMFDRLPYWNTEDSFSDKAYKSGIKYSSKGMELCWGISKYGKRKYVLKYDISNFVRQYTDSQGIYFNLINLDQSIKNAKIKIYSDYLFSSSNSKIWAFGYDGYINFKNGIIELDSDGKLSSSDYMVVLVKFEDDMFNLNNSLGKSFDVDYNSAMEGSDYNYKGSLYSKNEKRIILFSFIIFVVIPFLLIFVLKYFIDRLFTKNKYFVSKEEDDTLDFGMYGRNLPWDDQINYYRDIPCNKDIFRAYWVCYQYNVVSIDVLYEGLIGALLLKWVKEKRITIIKDESSFISFKDNNYRIDLSKLSHSVNSIENKLIDILKRAAFPKSVLESYDLINWCDKKHFKLESWFDYALEKEQEELEKCGFIVDNVLEIGNKNILLKKVSSDLRDDAINLKGLNKFLLEFSAIGEREYIDVHIWEEYLMFAELLGIADKVAEQFSKLYPDFVESPEFIFSTSFIIRNIARSSHSGMKRGIERSRKIKEKIAERKNRGSSRSSGRGGRSSRGGGRSAGGSSGGGFR